MLRWYPPAWRARYGDELMAMIEDEPGARRPTFRFNASMAWHGLRERGHEAGLLGDGASPGERVRSGSLLVLCAWAAFMLAGASFSKASEHFARALPPAGRGVPQVAFDVVAVLGVVGVTLVAVGALLAVPSFVRLLRIGGWTHVRGSVLRASLLTVVTVAGVLTLSEWAQHLSGFQRNGGDGFYAAAFGAWALLAAVTLGQWTGAAVAAARRIEFAAGVLRLQALLAIGVAGVMVVITGATALWWSSMAQSAPWFIDGTARGTSPSPFNLQLVVTLALMLAAALSAVYGVSRIVRAAGGLRSV